MKKYIITILLVVLIGVSYIYKQQLLKEHVSSNVVVETQNKEEVKETVKLKIYNASKSKIIEEEIQVNNKDFLTMGDYVKLTLENSKFLTNKMDFLSVYELSEKEVLVILSSEFEELSRSSFVAVVTTIKTNIKEAFPNVEIINVKLDSYE